MFSRFFTAKNGCPRFCSPFSPETPLKCQSRDKNGKLLVLDEVTIKADKDITIKLPK